MKRNRIWQLPNYVPRVLTLMQHARRGEAYISHIYHDDWCEYWSGGVCNCDPDVKFERITNTGGEKH